MHRSAHRYRYGHHLLFAWLILESANAFGQPARLTLQGNPTPTQAVVQFVAPDQNACTLALADATGVTTPWDTDGTKFAGADMDLGRPDTIVNGTSRVVVIGHRTVMAGADGKLYSRAMAANTPHTLTVTCAGMPSTLAFTTANYEPGNTFSEPPVWNSSAPGNLGWPSMDWADRTKVYVEPQTGLVFKRMMDIGVVGGKFGDTAIHADYYFDAVSAWSNAGNVVSGTTSALASSSSADAPLFVGIKPDTFPVNWRLPMTVDIAVHLYGSGSNSTPADRTVHVCLTLDSGQTCYGSGFDVTFPAGSAADLGSFPANFPSVGFRGWNLIYPVPVQALWNRFGTGTVTANAGALALTAGQSFIADWAGNTKIWIQGSAPACAHDLCTISQVTDSTHATVAENVTLASAAYAVASFGFRITKNNSLGTISVSAKANLAYSADPAGGAGGGANCSPLTYTTNRDANGNSTTHSYTGSFCATGSTAGPMIHFVTDEGEARPLGTTYAPLTATNPNPADYPNPFMVPPNPAFSSSDPLTMYVLGTDTAGNFAIFKIRYTGSFASWPGAWTVNPGGDVPQATLPEMFLEWTNLTPHSQNLDLNAQIAALAGVPSWARINSTSFAGVSGNFMWFNALRAAQETIGWVFVFDLTSGRLANHFSSYKGDVYPALKWGVIHNVSPISAGGGAILTINSTAAFGNPHPFSVAVAAVKKGAAWSTDASLPPTADGTYDSMCPGTIDPQFASLIGSNKCVSLQIPYEPCADAGYGDASGPCPGDPARDFPGATLGIGDYFSRVNGEPDTERFQILSKAGTNPITLVARRFLTNDVRPGTCSALPSQVTHPSQWSIAMQPAGVCNTFSAVYIAGENPVLVDATSNAGIGPVPFDGSHAAFGASPVPGQYRRATWSAATRPQPLTAFGSNADFSYPTRTSFAGLTGSTGPLQTYPVLAQWAAQGAEMDWMVDFRFPAGADGSDLTLAPGSARVYKVGVAGTHDAKRLALTVLGGRWLWKEKSSPTMGDTLTDSDLWKFCYAYRAGECRAGSMAGDVYAVIPGATTSAISYHDYFSHNAIAWPGQAVAGRALQVGIVRNDIDGRWVRHFGYTGGLPTLQTDYAQQTVVPSGKWAIVPNYGTEAFREVQQLLVRLPPWSSTMARTDFHQIAIQVGPVPYADVEFGYGEYGAPADFYCTARADSCNTRLAPFGFESENAAPTPCATGCTVSVAAISGRVLFYRVRTSVDGVNWTNGALQAVTVP